MVRPQARRDGVTVLIQERGYGYAVTRACGLIGISRSPYRYRSCRAGSQKIAARLKELAAVKRRWGYRQLHVLQRREGYAVNRKRTYRLYRDAGLAVKRRKRKRYAVGERRPLPKPTAPNVSWSMDFVADALAETRGRPSSITVDHGP